MALNRIYVVLIALTPRDSTASSARTQVGPPSKTYTKLSDLKAICPSARISTTVFR